jgi:hypothetical protein
MYESSYIKAYNLKKEEFSYKSLIKSTNIFTKLKVTGLEIQKELLMNNGILKIKVFKRQKKIISSKSKYIIKIKYSKFNRTAFGHQESSQIIRIPITRISGFYRKQDQANFLINKSS